MVAQLYGRGLVIPIPVREIVEVGGDASKIVVAIGVVVQVIIVDSLRIEVVVVVIVVATPIVSRTSWWKCSRCWSSSEKAERS